MYVEPMDCFWRQNFTCGGIGALFSHWMAEIGEQGLKHFWIWNIQNWHAQITRVQRSIKASEALQSVFVWNLCLCLALHNWLSVHKRVLHLSRVNSLLHRNLQVFLKAYATAVFLFNSSNQSLNVNFGACLDHFSYLWTFVYRRAFVKLTQHLIENALKCLHAKGQQSILWRCCFLGKLYTCKIVYILSSPVSASAPVDLRWKCWRCLKMLWSQLWPSSRQLQQRCSKSMKSTWSNTQGGRHCWLLFS